ncbi:MAG TPA: NAD-dependent epimerase/dehydratase family protein [Vicinamibacterales bacterium]|jgi:nucleoside-diphosphate-sugar epimerase|nr:NAD-dependent epimerase/dehydratase family protein [Vicinamibacterales bacterium]
MQIFLTGATGYIGSAVLETFVRAGHDVTGLVRNPEKAEFVSRRGVRAVIGDLDKPASYAAEAERAEVVIHTALDGSPRRDAVDRRAVDTFLAAATNRVASGLTAAFIYTSGIWVLGDTPAPVAEDAPVNPTPHVAWRPAHERLVLDAGRSPTVRTVVLRPGIVYGESRGIIADLLKDAANGLVRVIGEGKNHWPCVYARDLADVYLRVATNPAASGVFHANDEADETVGDIVDAIAHHVRMRPDVRHVPMSEARAKMGAYADALALDQRIRSPRARALGWSPTLHSVAGNVAGLLEEFRARREAA